MSNNIFSMNGNFLSLKVGINKSINTLKFLFLIALVVLQVLKAYSIGNVVEFKSIDSLFNNLPCYKNIEIYKVRGYVKYNLSFGKSPLSYFEMKVLNERLGIKNRDLLSAIQVFDAVNGKGFYVCLHSNCLSLIRRLKPNELFKVDGIFLISQQNDEVVKSLIITKIVQKEQF
jgi:hypothetical protein